jgi:aspartate racemase
MNNLNFPHLRHSKLLSQEQANNIYPQKDKTPFSDLGNWYSESLRKNDWEKLKTDTLENLATINTEELTKLARERNWEYLKFKKNEKTVVLNFTENGPLVATNEKGFRQLNDAKYLQDLRNLAIDSCITYSNVSPDNLQEIKECLANESKKLQTYEADIENLRSLQAAKIEKGVDPTQKYKVIRRINESLDTLKTAKSKTKGRIHQLNEILFNIIHIQSPESRKKIGIITGSGPEAGADMWNKILQWNRAILGENFRGDIDAPDITMDSISKLGLSMELDINDKEVWICLKSAAEKIAKDVDYYAIACNTLNYYEPQIAGLALPAKFVSFAQVVLNFLQENNIKNVALLGSRPVTELGKWSHYRQLAEHVDIEQLEPEQAKELHELIYAVKIHGGKAGHIQERFKGFLSHIKSETILLACTELPLIPVEAGQRRLVDVTDLVAQKLAKLSQEKKAQTAHTVSYV